MSNSSVPTSQELDDLWKEGYIEGYRKAKQSTHTPTIPSRPDGYPPGVDPKKYYYNEGEKAGAIKALQENSGIQKP